MKSTALCCICKKNFSIKELKSIPWPQKNAWNTVGAQKYKFHCPHCNSCLLPEKELDESAIIQLNQIRAAMAISAILLVVLVIFGLGIYGLYILIIVNSAILTMFYKMAKYKTRNIFGSGILKMNPDNDL